MATFINQVKNIINPSNPSKGGFFILLENGGYILQEDGFKIFLEAVSFGVNMINLVKHTVSPTNQTKN